MYKTVKVASYFTFNHNCNQRYIKFKCVDVGFIKKFIAYSPKLGKYK